MTVIPKPIRVEPAFDDPERIRAMFEQYAPYPAVAAYGLDVFVDENTNPEGKRSVLPWFRGDWALGGKPLVDGADLILHNRNFLKASQALFRTSRVHPEYVVVNVNAPMPAGPTHTDVPSFYGATRGNYSLPFLLAMGSSGLFETWRVVRAGAVAWFYDGTRGSFDYWPEGPDGPMRSEQPPFNNVALVADNDRMYHRIGAIGDPNAELPRISASASVHPDGNGNWAIVENGVIRAIYPGRAMRLSVVWRAAVEERALSTSDLTLDRIMAIFIADLRRRRVDFRVPSDPLTDAAWIPLLQAIYADSIAFMKKP